MLLLPEIKPGALDLEDLTSASPMLAKGLRDVSLTATMTGRIRLCLF